MSVRLFSSQRKHCCSRSPPTPAASGSPATSARHRYRAFPGLPRSALLLCRMELLLLAAEPNLRTRCSLRGLHDFSSPSQQHPRLRRLWGEGASIRLWGEGARMNWQVVLQQGLGEYCHRTLYPSQSRSRRSEAYPHGISKTYMSPIKSTFSTYCFWLTVCYMCHTGLHHECVSSVTSGKGTA